MHISQKWLKHCHWFVVLYVVTILYLRVLKIITRFYVLHTIKESQSKKWRWLYLKVNVQFRNLSNLNFNRIRLVKIDCLLMRYLHVKRAAWFVNMLYLFKIISNRIFELFNKLVWFKQKVNKKYGGFLNLYFELKTLIKWDKCLHQSSFAHDDVSN